MCVVKLNNALRMGVIRCGHSQSAEVLYLAGIVVVGNRPAPFQGHMLGRDPHLHDLHRLDPTKTRDATRTHSSKHKLIFMFTIHLVCFACVLSLVTFASGLWITKL